MSTRRVAIETLYQGLYDGPHATPKPSNDGPVFLGIGNITDDGSLDLSDIRHIAEEDYPTWTKRVTPQAGDIVFTYEATLNRYAIIPQGFRGCLGRRTALIRPNPVAVNGRFLFFYLFSEDWRKTIERNILSGATVDRIPLTKFPDFPITLPDRSVQDRIADILSAYDDLIENNTRRIKILENMAQMLYREWFVNFRFPGHKKVRMVKSELGQIPEGWRIETIGDLLTLKSGFAFRSSTFNSRGKFGLVTIRNVDNGFFSPNCQSRIAEAPSNLPNFCILQPGDVLMSLTGNIGRTCLVHGRSLLLNQRVAKVMPHRDEELPFVYVLLRQTEMQTRLEQISTGVAQQNLSPVRAMQERVIAPSPTAIHRFCQVVGPMTNVIVSLFTKNTNLRTTRDLLLPKLISGEISVEAAEEAMEQTA